MEFNFLSGWWFCFIGTFNTINKVRAFKIVKLEFILLQQTDYNILLLTLNKLFHYLKVDDWCAELYREVFSEIELDRPFGIYVDDAKLGIIIMVTGKFSQFYRDTLDSGYMKI